MKMTKKMTKIVGKFKKFGYVVADEKEKSIHLLFISKLFGKRILIQNCEYGTSLYILDDNEQISTEGQQINLKNWRMADYGDASASVSRWVFDSIKEHLGFKTEFCQYYTSINNKNKISAA